MIEIPEAVVLANQLNEDVCGRRVDHVIMNNSPHKFAFYYGDSSGYDSMLSCKTFEKASSYGGMVELASGDYKLVFSDGVNLKFYENDSILPAKHQMLIRFSDGSTLIGSIQMYGGLWCFVEGEFKNEYRFNALSKPSPLSMKFDNAYFETLINTTEFQKLNLKAFLATEQRIPGLGNGVIQDILWSSKLHPKRKLKTLDNYEKDRLFKNIKNKLNSMVSLGGRDTEKDLFGKPGKYNTKMSNLNYSKGCPECKSPIIKESYMGGSIYYCPICQTI